MRDQSGLVMNVLDSPVGLVAVAGPDPTVAFIRLRVESPEEAVRSIEADYRYAIRYDPESFARLMMELSEYFKGRLRRFRSPYSLLVGTDFQKQVWEFLGKIPYGETVSYGRVAVAVGRPRAVRAVGQAVGRNPLPIVFPCHRVINSDGRLGGFTGGIHIKSRLLELEADGRRETAIR